MKVNGINFYKYNNSLNKAKQKSVQTPCERSYTQPLYYTHNINFTSLKHRAILDPNVFFVPLEGYKTDRLWAKNMKEETCVCSSLIKKGIKFPELLSQVEKSVAKVNKSHHFGTPAGDVRGFALFENRRGREYYSRYRDKFPKLKNSSIEYVSVNSNEEYKDADTVKISNSGNMLSIFYGGGFNNLRLAEKEYNKLQQIVNPTIDDINKSVATIHWLIAQSSPYERGNDSIANIITKSIYHAHGVRVFPLKSGHSFDFEAFYNDLDDFIQIYPYLFEKPPEKI